MSGDPTPPLEAFRDDYAEDDNEWWRLSGGDHQNLFEEAVDQLDEARAEVNRLQVQVVNLNRWVERVNAKRITDDAIERGAKALHAQRYGWGDHEDWGDPEVQKIYREEAEACLRAGLATAKADV